MKRYVLSDDARLRQSKTRPLKSLEAKRAGNHQLPEKGRRLTTVPYPALPSSTLNRGFATLAVISISKKH